MLINEVNDVDKGFAVGNRDYKKNKFAYFKWVV